MNAALGFTVAAMLIFGLAWCVGFGHGVHYALTHPHDFDRDDQ